jgi:peptidoglycan hydrolase FlgJ
MLAGDSSRDPALAIKPPTDIVLDVARAADPHRLEAATRKLTRAAGEGEAYAAVARALETEPAGLKAGDLVEDVLLAADPAREAAAVARLEALAENRSGRIEPDSLREGADLHARLAPLSAPRSAPEETQSAALRELESFTLSRFVEAMLPSAEAGFFGTGTGGEVWRSMTADQLGKVLADSGATGLAERLDPSPSQQPAQGPEPIARTRAWPYFALPRLDVLG